MFKIASPYSEILRPLAIEILNSFGAIAYRLGGIISIFWIISDYFPFENNPQIDNFSQLIKNILFEILKIDHFFFNRVDWSPLIEKINKFDLSCFFITFLNIGPIILLIIAANWIHDIFSILIFRIFGRVVSIFKILIK
jgi:hypothetical protein